MNHTPNQIANHINGLIAGKFLSKISDNNHLYFKIEKDNEMFVCCNDDQIQNGYKEINKFVLSHSGKQT